MYNRYTPAQDGSYRRNRIPDAAAPEAQQTPPPQEIPENPVSVSESPVQDMQETAGTHPMHFLSDLLPKDMDKGDLLVLLILLLLISDGTEDAANPLLTLALFFLLR